MTYDPAAFWSSYEVKDRGDEWARQEAAVFRALILADASGAGSVLEVGPGDGRITRMLNPDATTLLDIDPRRLGPGDVLADVSEWEPERTWDLVVAVEVLMHVRPDRARRAVAALLAASSGYVLTCDWTSGRVEEPAPHNWLHDYGDLFRRAEVVYAEPVGRQTVYLWRAR